MKRFLPGILYAAVLTAFTAYVLLDAFVIPRAYGGVPDTSVTSVQTTVTVSSGKSATATAAKTTAPTTMSSGTGDSDGQVSITLNQYRQNDTTVYVADVTASSPGCLKTALAQNTYGRNIKAATSAIAASQNAVLAINGDFYGARTSGYVIRNGVLYRSVSAGNDDLVIWRDGSFGIISETSVTAQELLDKGAVQVLSFGPVLVTGSQVAVSTGAEVGQSMTSNPRTALAITADGHYLFVVSDGRTDESAGLSLYQLASFLKGLGAVTAYNLDGGGSSTMYYQGEVVNQPTTDGQHIRERSVSDIVYISA